MNVRAFCKAGREGERESAKLHRLRPAPDQDAGAVSGMVRFEMAGLLVGREVGGDDEVDNR